MFVTRYFFLFFYTKGDLFATLMFVADFARCKSTGTMIGNSYTKNVKLYIWTNSREDRGKGFGALHFCHSSRSKEVDNKRSLQTPVVVVIYLERTYIFIKSWREARSLISRTRQLLSTCNVNGSTCELTGEGVLSASEVPLEYAEYAQIKFVGVCFNWLV